MQIYKYSSYLFGKVRDNFKRQIQNNDSEHVQRDVFGKREIHILLDIELLESKHKEVSKSILEKGTAWQLRCYCIAFL